MKHKPQSYTNAKILRSAQTDAEKLMWSHLRNNKLGYKFRRQHPIQPYIVDFACIERKIVVELDGGQHTIEKDNARSQFLMDNGFEILRFWNDDMLTNTDGVLHVIYTKLQNAPHPIPLPTDVERVLKG